MTRLTHTLAMTMLIQAASPSARRSSWLCILVRLDETIPKSPSLCYATSRAAHLDLVFTADDTLELPDTILCRFPFPQLFPHGQRAGQRLILGTSPASFLAIRHQGAIHLSTATTQPKIDREGRTAGGSELFSK
jgi:hypothetical protein